MAAALRLYRPTAVVDHRFAGLVLLSLLLHGGLFVLMPGPRPVVPALPKLLATLRLPALPESGVARAAPVPAALPQKVRPSPAAAANRPVPQRLQTAGPASVPASPLAAATPLAPSAPSSGMSPLAAASELPSAVPTASPVAAADALAAYRLRLAELLARHQEYPRVAALRGWQGEVRLRLRVARRGNLLAVDLDQSSGFTVLDQHAQAMLAELGGLPPLPELLEGSEIQVVVPITYKLNKTT
jgi:protein TonB